MFIHLDLDAFFINAARTQNHDLKGISAAVISGNCFDIFGDFLPPGIVLSASYEARAKGIKCTMKAQKAQKIDPQIKLVSTEFALYKRLSKELFNILYSYTNEIEKYSIDEYFMDLKGTKHDENALNLAKEIKERVLKELDLPCSIGIAPHKWQAKLATSLAKPDGIFKINDIKEVANIDIAEFAGVGKACFEALRKKGIFTIGDALGANDVFKGLGKNGISLYEHICGLSGDELRKKESPKSLCIARTFASVKSRDEIKRRIRILCNNLHFELNEQGLIPKKLELKFTYEYSKPISHSILLNAELSSNALYNEFCAAFNRFDTSKNLGVIYLSVGAFDFSAQKGLFWQEKTPKQKALDNALFRLRDKYSTKII